MDIRVKCLNMYILSIGVDFTSIILLDCSSMEKSILEINFGDNAIDIAVDFLNRRGVMISSYSTYGTSIYLLGE
jgi:hypothetical protein